MCASNLNLLSISTPRSLTYCCDLISMSCMQSPRFVPFTPRNFCWIGCYGTNFVKQLCTPDSKEVMTVSKLLLQQ